MPASHKSTNVRTRSTQASVRALRVGLRAVSLGAPEVAAGWAARIFTTAQRHPRPAWERELLAGARPFVVKHGPGILPAWSFGHEQDPTVLLVHGWEGRGSQLAAFAPALVARGLRVVAFDAPGHGGSSLSRGSLIDHARAIATLASAVGPLQGVVAHSMGGAAALVAMRFGLAAERLVLIAPPSSPRGYVEGFRKALGLTPEVESRMVQRLEQKLDVPFSTLDATLDAARLNAPLLVVHDVDDKEVPVAEGRRVAGAAPNARLVETVGLGHRRILRDEAVIEEVASFIRSAAPASANDCASMVRLGAANSFAATLEGELYFSDARRA